MKMTRRHAVLATAVLAAATCAGVAHAKTYPSKPITIVVSYPPGGDTDIVARTLAEKLAARVGQSVLVDNRPGASGSIGNAYVSNAEPDGHTLLLSPGTLSSAPVVLKEAVNYDVVNGFTPIMQTGSVPLFLVTAHDTGFNTLKDVVTAAKSGKKLSYGSPGNGSPMHFVGEMLNKAAGINILHVPYRGVAPAVNDLLGSHLPLAWVPYGPVEGYLKNGRLKVLAVAQPERSPLLADVPTLEELGYKGVNPMSWQGLLGPKGMSPELVGTLYGHMQEIMKDPAVRARMATIGTEAQAESPEQLTRSKNASYEMYKRLVQEMNIQAD
ncbi:MAG: tripartite tricarboxylate transporter substrate binding protein [Pigmentiphaga sp.]|nr:tripartite tricarboxylate transporter substrate binding protein [Pigmentiphaga sp.]